MDHEVPPLVPLEQLPFAKQPDADRLQIWRPQSQPHHPPGQCWNVDSSTPSRYLDSGKGVLIEYRKLGKTDIDVSVFALGCWPFAGGAFWGEQDDDVSIATVHAALDTGICFFDTAEGYERGHSERVLGRGLEGRHADRRAATGMGG